MSSLPPPVHTHTHTVTLLYISTLHVCARAGTRALRGTLPARMFYFTVCTASDPRSAPSMVAYNTRARAVVAAARARASVCVCV